jgi:hypothetical protein
VKNLRLQRKNSANEGDSSLPLVAQNDSKWVSYLSAIPKLSLILYGSCRFSKIDLKLKFIKAHPNHLANLE